MKKKITLKEDIDVRQATDRLLELVDSGALPAEGVLLAALKYMSEEQVAEMAEANGFFEEQETEVDENLLREAFEAGYKAAGKLNEGLYEITYDYCSEDGYDEKNIRETFDGSWTELQDYIKQMKKNGCYNIDATAIDDN